MKGKWFVAIGLTLVLAMVGLVGCEASGNLQGLPDDLRIRMESQQEGIWVNGTGKVAAAPDIAILGLGIEAQAVSVAEAQSQAAKAMDDVMKTLTDNGVAKKDIQTTVFSITQVTRWDQDKQRETVIGYRVTNRVTAKIRVIDKTGTIIDTAAAAGGDLIRIDSVSFSIDDPANAVEEARQKAMADARTKAEQLAKLGGVKLGKATYIAENTYYPVPIYRSDIAMGGGAIPAPAPTAISPGEMEISITVQVTYAILD
ncbi:MAG: SIMPL domain-containing protein [Dehalococcoidales bacterium]|nr:SIMPL domain-containing protein [Dehalococcoidales bacterium]